MPQHNISHLPLGANPPVDVDVNNDAIVEIHGDGDDRVSLHLNLLLILLMFLLVMMPIITLLLMVV